MPFFEPKIIRGPRTPEERDAWLDEPTDLYYHRDGTRVKTHREGMEIFRVMHTDRHHPDFFRVAQTVFPRRGRLSTVFLAMDHSFHFGSGPEPPPLIFETMLFATGDWSGGFQWRYSTEAEAKAGHRKIARAIYKVIAWNLLARVFGLEPRFFDGEDIDV